MVQLTSSIVLLKNDERHKFQRGYLQWVEFGVTSVIPSTLLVLPYNQITCVGKAAPALPLSPAPSQSSDDSQASFQEMK